MNFDFFNFFVSWGIIFLIWLLNVRYNILLVFDGCFRCFLINIVMFLWLIDEINIFIFSIIFCFVLGCILFVLVFNVYFILFGVIRIILKFVVFELWLILVFSVFIMVKLLLLLLVRIKWFIFSLCKINLSCFFEILLWLWMIKICFGWVILVVSVFGEVWIGLEDDVGVVLLYWLKFCLNFCFRVGLFWIWRVFVLYKFIVLFLLVFIWCMFFLLKDVLIVLLMV